MGFLYLVCQSSFAIILVFVCLNYITLEPEFTPKVYVPNLPSKLEGPLAPNGQLDSFEALFKDELVWPESLALGPDGAIYTGTADGTIKRVSSKDVKVVARTGKPCAGQWEEELCGRPLGLRFDSKGLLHAVDAYYGYYIINVKSGSSEVVVPAATMVDDLNMMFLNDLHVTNDAVYFTQSSTKYLLKNVVMSLTEHENSGRLLKYDMKTKTVQVLAKDLFFPNGVQLSNDGSFLMIAEASNHTILRYDLKGADKGKLSVLIDKLPGEPDNIRPSTQPGHYWVAVNHYRTSKSIDLADLASQFPYIRKAFINLNYIFGSILLRITQYYQCPKFHYFASELYSSRLIVDLIPGLNGQIIKFNEKGEIVQSLSSSGGKISKLSEVLEYNGNLYIGSWRNSFLAKVKFQG